MIKTNQCCSSGMIKAGWMLLIVIVGEFLNNVPVVWRFYSYIPFINWITKERTDFELQQMSKCNKDSCKQNWKCYEYIYLIIYSFSLMISGHEPQNTNVQILEKVNWWCDKSDFILDQLIYNISYFIYLHFSKELFCCRSAYEKKTYTMKHAKVNI